MLVALTTARVQPSVRRAAAGTNLDPSRIANVGGRAPWALRVRNRHLGACSRLPARRRSSRCWLLRQPRCSFCLERVVIQIRRMNQRCCLIRDCRRQAGMCVPERRDADSGDEIEILTPLGIEQPCAAPPYERDRLPLVRLYDVA